MLHGEVELAGQDPNGAAGEPGGGGAGIEAARALDQRDRRSDLMPQ